MQTCLTLATSRINISSPRKSNSFLSWNRSVRKSSPIFCKANKHSSVREIQKNSSETKCFNHTALHLRKVKLKRMGLYFFLRKKRKAITSAMMSARPGLQSSSHRRGVMPLVLFWNFSGSMSQKSLNLKSDVNKAVSILRSFHFFNSRFFLGKR